jgi:hypothetical protein
MIRASREAQRQLYTQNPAVTGYRRQATQDARVCLACLALSGTLQATDTIMPSHPNCRCVMIPETLSWAEITGDSSIPDTRPEVATPDRILAGLTDAEKMAIMGPARFELYKNGKPLLDMVQVKQDKDWGPTTNVLPLRDIGGPLRVQPPKPPKTPKVVQSPKPIEVVIQPINRDPQALLEELRKLRPTPRSKEDIENERKQIDIERQEFLKPFIYAGKITEGITEWKKTNGHRLWALAEEENGVAQIPDEVLQKMHTLLFAEKSISTSVDFPKKALLSQGQTVIPDDYRDGLSDAVTYVSKFIDDRPLSNYTQKFNPDIDINAIKLAIHNKRFVYGYCEEEDEGIIALNMDALNFKKKFEPTFKTNTSFRNVAHEMMHWIDLRDENMRKRVSAFFEKRTAMDSDWEISPYGGQYKPDKWPDAYCGQRYVDFENRHGYGLEVPSRGMEYLLSNPLKFAEDDFEYFSFMITEVLGNGK